MDFLKQILLLILAISFFTFLTFFGRLPALRKTPVGMLYRIVWLHLPHTVSTLDQRLTAGRLTSFLSWLFHRVMYERHPTIVVFFLAIMMVGEYLYIPQAWPHISWWSRLTVAATILMPYVFLYLACSADPGYITPDNVGYHMALYPYDHGIFHPGNECRTCRLIKPPRSKHCDVCKRCIARADHHCVFINSCVGQGNHHYFLLLLASTALLTAYGGCLGLSLLTARMRALNPAWSFWPSTAMDWDTYLLVVAWGLRGNAALGTTTLLALLSSPLVAGLLAYSLFLVYCGTTTNESMKWSDYGDEIADGCAYRRPLGSGRVRDLRYEPPCDRWPAEPEHVMLATEDGRPPPPDAPFQGKGEWERVGSLRDVENLYDRGFWHNLGDIFVKDYAFGVGRRGEPLAGKIE